MTDPTDTGGTTTQPDTAQPSLADSATAATDPDGATESSGNHEAAKYRRQLRETQAERDTLATQVQTLQRQHAERIAEQTLPKPNAMWANGTQLSDLLADDGTVDPDKVTAAAQAAATALGIVRTNASGGIIPGAGIGQGAREDDRAAEPGWADLLRR